MTARTPDLNDLYFFVQIVDHQGFTAAGRALGVPKSTLSHRLAELEKRLGVRLVHRTSRSFVVTDIGNEFLRHARGMLIEAEAAEHVVKRRIAEPSGTVRFTCSVAMAENVAELLPRFLLRFPKVDLIQHSTNRYVGMVEEGFVDALRGHSGPLADSGLMQRPLAASPGTCSPPPATSNMRARRRGLLICPGIADSTSVGVARRPGGR